MARKPAQPHRVEISYRTMTNSKARLIVKRIEFLSGEVSIVVDGMPGGPLFLRVTAARNLARELVKAVAPESDEDDFACLYD